MLTIARSELVLPKTLRWHIQVRESMQKLDFAAALYNLRKKQKKQGKLIGRLRAQLHASYTPHPRSAGTSCAISADPCAGEEGLCYYGHNTHRPPRRTYAAVRRWCGAAVQGGNGRG